MHDMWGNMLFYLGRMTKYLKKINQSSKAINYDWTPGVKCEVSVGSPIFTKNIYYIWKGKTDGSTCIFGS